MGRDVAVDVHRRSLYVLIESAPGVEVLRRRFPHTAAGEAALLAELRPGDRVILEATSGAYRLANRLESSGAEVHVVDAAQVPALGARGKKSDYRDCQALLQHLRGGKLAEVWRPDLGTRRRRQLTRERAAYNQGITRLKNRLQALLWEEGLTPPCKLWSEAGRTWLFTEALPALPATARGILLREWAALQVLAETKQEQEAELAREGLDLPEVPRLLQLPGFGIATAVMFLAEVGSVGRFPSAKHLVSYAGLNPKLYQSGATRRCGSVSKAGRPQLRWLMIEVAWAHVRAGGAEAALFHRLVQRGKLEAEAITALARHLLVVAYQLLKRQENYRGLAPTSYERKLAVLGGYRPESEADPRPNVVWASEQFTVLTGAASPYQRAHPEGCSRRRVVRQGRAVAPAAAGGARTGTGAGRQGAAGEPPEKSAGASGPEGRPSGASPAAT